eukprot:897214-Amphidinium_carterae.1
MSPKESLTWSLQDGIECCPLNAACPTLVFVVLHMFKYMLKMTFGWFGQVSPHAQYNIAGWNPGDCWQHLLVDSPLAWIYALGPKTHAHTTHARMRARAHARTGACAHARAHTHTHTHTHAHRTPLSPPVPPPS